MSYPPPAEFFCPRPSAEKNLSGEGKEHPSKQTKRTISPTNPRTNLRIQQLWLSLPRW